MARAKEGGFSFLNLLVLIFIFAILLAFSFLIILEEHYLEIVKNNFKVFPSNLSVSEKVVIRPMVHSVLSKLDYEVTMAKIKEDILLERTTDITPDDVEQILSDFRSAHKEVEATRKELRDACEAAIYYRLINKDFHLCK